MKTIFVIDQLIKKTPATYLLELLLTLDHEADIFTLAYQPTEWRGKFNSHRIIASPLNHTVTNHLEFQTKSWMIPSLVSKLPWPANPGKIIVISEGWAQLMLPDSLKSQAILYLFDFPEITLKGWRKIFKPFLTKQRLKSLAGFKNLLVSSERWKALLPQATLISPTFPTAEFVATSSESIPHKILIHTQGLRESETQFLLAEFPEAMFFGSHYSSLKIPNEKYLGDHCEGTLASLHLESLVVFDLSGDFFPVKALQAGLSGRPVVVRENVDKSFLPTDSFWTLPSHFQREELRNLKKLIDTSALGVDRAVVRRQSLKWNERYFKTKFQLYLKEINL